MMLIKHMIPVNYRPQGRRSIGRPKNVGESNYNPGDGTDQRI